MSSVSAAARAPKRSKGADLQTADPDLSNPTRPRLERPLDTIRSFEKAIDNGYKRRSSMMRGGEFGPIRQHCWKARADLALAI